MTVWTLEMSAAQTTAPTGSMTGATLTAFVSMITRSAFLPGVIEPVRSAMPATLAPSSVAQRRTWRTVIRSGVAVCRRGPRPTPPGAGAPRSEAKIACICVNWSDEAVVATSDDSPTGMPERRRRRRRRPAVAHLELDLRRERDVAAGVADHLPLVVEQVRGVDVGRVRVEQVQVLERRAAASSCSRTGPSPRGP